MNHIQKVKDNNELEEDVNKLSSAAQIIKKSETVEGNWKWDSLIMCLFRFPEEVKKVRQMQYSKTTRSDDSSELKTDTSQGKLKAKLKITLKNMVILPQKRWYRDLRAAKQKRVQKSNQNNIWLWNSNNESLNLVELHI